MRGAQTSGVHIRPGSPLTILGNQFTPSTNPRQSMESPILQVGPRNGSNPPVQMNPTGTQGVGPRSGAVLITPGGKRGLVGPSGRDILELTKRAKLEATEQQIELSTALKKQSVLLQPAVSQSSGSANVTMWKGPPPKMEIMSTSKDGGLFSFISQKQDTQETSHELQQISPQLHPQHGKIKIKRYIIVLYVMELMSWTLS